MIFWTLVFFRHGVGYASESLTRQRQNDDRSEFNVVHLLVDTGALREREIRGTGAAYDTLAAARKSFLDQIKDGTATATTMLNFVMLIDDVGNEVIPSSEGMAWMWHNADRFAEIVGDVDVFVEAALRVFDQAQARQLPYEESARPLAHWFFRSFPCSAELMALLSPAWRERFVRELVPRFGPDNNSWIAAAIQNGVPRHVVAQAILTRLRNVKVERGIAHSMMNFLRYGTQDRHDGSSPVPSTLRRLGEEFDGRRYNALARDPSDGWETIERIVRERMAAIEEGQRVPTRPYELFMYFHLHETPSEAEKWRRCFDGLDEWAALTNLELEEALLICAEKDPEQTVVYREKMLRRLDPDAVDIIIADAMGRLASISGVPDAEIARLTLAQRKRLAERLQPAHERYVHKATAQFLFRLVVDLPAADREAFFLGTVERVLKEASVPALYAAWRQLELEEPDLEATLRRWLVEEGYRIGKIVARPHPKGGTQMAVEIGRYRYVQERGSHRYFPAVDDEVLFPHEGRHLTPMVIAVNFIPVMKDARD